MRGGRGVGEVAALGVGLLGDREFGRIAALSLDSLRARDLEEAAALSVIAVTGSDKGQVAALSVDLPQAKEVDGGAALSVIAVSARGVGRAAALSVDSLLAKELDGAAALSVIAVKGLARVAALSSDLLRYNGLRRLAAGVGVDFLDRRTFDEWVGWCALAAVDETAVSASAYVARFLMNAVHLVHDFEGGGVVGVGLHCVFYAFCVG